MWPCRTARFGSAIISSGLLQLKRSQYLSDFGPLDPECTCFVCKDYTRSYLSNIFGQTPLAAHLLTYHNLFFMKSFMTRLRQSILDQKFAAFANDFLERNYANHEYPSWVVDALTDAGVPFRHAPNPCTAEMKKEAPKDVSCMTKKSHQRQKAKTQEEKDLERAKKKQKRNDNAKAQTATSSSATEEAQAQA